MLGTGGCYLYACGSDPVPASHGRANAAGVWDLWHWNLVETADDYVHVGSFGGNYKPCFPERFFLEEIFP